jgi:hypothetical protein
MTLNFTTLFDSYYLNRGLAMYDSLKKVCPDFHLYIFAFDKKAYSILKKLNLADATIISLEEFEDEKLLGVKGGRTKGEYCWTCTPSTIYYCINQFNLDHCTYIDADLFFFSDPTVLINELQDDSVLITEHRYTKKYDQSSTSGIYCVQFVTFRNTAEGQEVLTWWRDRCMEWCYDRFEDGKFGDQKYLDDWTTRFKGVHVLNHLGGGVAPWNVQQLEVKRNNVYTVIEKRTHITYDLIFYHFHAVRFLKDGNVDFGSYSLSNGAKKLYHHYLINIETVNKKLQSLEFRPIVQPYQTKKSMPHFAHKLARRALGVYNIYKMDNLISYGKNP